MSNSGFDELADLAMSRSGQAFLATQHYLVEARLAHILRRENFSTLSELAECLRARPNPVFEDEVVAALTNKNSAFFRDRRGLSHMVETVLPKMAAVKSEAGDDTPLRVLCAGGGAGQEAYSLAILLDEADAPDLEARGVELVSLDICRASTERGKAGLFGHFEIQTGLSVHRMLKYFSRTDDRWCISEDLRGKVRFDVANLMQPLDEPVGFDIILCRHVLSGMASSIGKGVAERLAGSLLPEGLLFLGDGEPLGADISALSPSYDARNAWCLAKDDDARMTSDDDKASNSTSAIA